MFKLFIYIFWFVLSFSTISSAELEQSIEQSQDVEDENPSEYTSGDDLIDATQIAPSFQDLPEPSNASDPIEFDLKDAAISLNVNKHGDQNSYIAFRRVKDAASRRLDTIEEQTDFFEELIFFTPSQLKNPIKDLDSDFSVGVGVVGISVPLGQFNELGLDQKSDYLIGLKELRHTWESPDTPEPVKYLISEYFKVYLDFDINKTPEELESENNGDLIELKALLDEFEKGNNELKTELIEHVDRTLRTEMDQLHENIKGDIGEALEEISKETTAITKLVDDATSSIQVGVLSANAKLDYLKEQDMKREVKQKITTITNADKLSDLINATKNCSQNSPGLECDILQSEFKNMESRLKKLRYNDIRSTTRSGLVLARDIALLAKDERTAKYIQDAILIFDTANKISDLASGLSNKSSMAAAGDVMSMASLAISLYNALGSNGKSTDQLMMEQLRQIRVDIQNFRVEMHKRLDQISAKLDSLGIGLNLRIDSLSDSMNVAIENQEIIERLITQESIKINGLILGISNNTSTINMMKELSFFGGNIRSWDEPDEVAKAMLNYLSSFSSSLKYNLYTIDLLPEAQVGQNNLLASSEALILASNAFGLQGEANYALYGIIDYLLKNNKKFNLSEQNCDADFSNIHLFNILGSMTADILKSEFATLPKDSDERNKFNYVMNNFVVNKSEIYKNFQDPLDDMQKIINQSQECLNNYAKSDVDLDNDKDNLNIVSYLIQEFYNEVRKQKAIALNNLKEIHFEKLMESILDPNGKHFGKEQGFSFVNVDPMAPAKRRRIDLSVYENFSKPIEEYQDVIDERFLKKYKVVNVCERSKAREYHKPQRFKQQTIYKNENYSAIELPDQLLFQLFSTPEMRAALVTNVNEITICYTPLLNSVEMNNLSIGTYLDDRRTWSDLNVRDYTPTVAAMPMVLSIDILENDSFKIEKGDDLKNADTVNNIRRKTITTKVRILTPVNDIKLSTDYTREEELHLFNIYFVWSNRHYRPAPYIRAQDFNSYVTSSQFKTGKWMCEKSVNTGFVENCFIEGNRPSEQDEKIWQDIEKKSLSLGLVAVPTFWSTFITQSNRDVKVNMERFDTQGSQLFRNRLNANGFFASLSKIQSDLRKCYVRSYLGESTCDFDGYSSSLTLDQKANWLTLNQTEILIKKLSPLLTKFKKDVSLEEKLKFNNDLNEMLISPAHRLVELSLEGDVTEFTSKFELELEQSNNELLDLIQRSENLIEVDIDGLLKNEVATELKYYQSFVQ